MKNFLVPLLILENGTSQVAVALQLVEARSEERDALVVTSGSEEPGPEPGNAAIAIKAQLDVRSDGGVKLTTISIKLRLGRAGGWGSKSTRETLPRSMYSLEKYPLTMYSSTMYLSAIAAVDAATVTTSLLETRGINWQDWQIFTRTTSDDPLLYGIGHLRHHINCHREGKPSPDHSSSSLVGNVMLRQIRN